MRQGLEGCETNMSFEIFIEEDRQRERELLASYDLDVAFFDKLNFKIKQIVPERNCFRVETDKGFYCLKKMSISNDDMSLMQQLTEHLRINGFTETFETVKHQNGEILVPYAGSQYYLTYWMDGRESDYLNLLDIKEAVEALARFHISSEGFVPKAAAEHRSLYGRWQRGFMQRLEEMQAARELILAECKGTSDQMLLDYLADCMQRASASISYTQSAVYEKVNKRDEDRKGFIHHEYGFHNLLHTFDSRTFVGGLENFAFDIRMHDLGHLIFKLMRKKGWDIEQATSMLSFYDGIYKLQKEDYQALAAYLTFPHDYRQLYKQHYIQSREVEDLEELDKINMESDYNQCKISFLREFEKYAGTVI